MNALDNGALRPEHGLIAAGLLGGSVFLGYSAVRGALDEGIRMQQRDQAWMERRQTGQLFANLPVYYPEGDNR